MKENKIKTENGQIFKVKDYRNLEIDYRKKINPEILPVINQDFFKSQGYRIPVIKLDNGTYIFPTNSKSVSKKSTISDYQDFCVVDLDQLVLTNKHSLKIAKELYDKNPTTIANGYTGKIRKKRFTVIRSNSMSMVQSNLSKSIYGVTNWDNHKEIIEEVKYKQNDIKMNTSDLESTYSKGEETSYGRSKMNMELIESHGLLVKLQNGGNVNSTDILAVNNSVTLFFDSVLNLQKEFSDFSMLISYSREMKMFARNAIGLFNPYLKVIGVSNQGNINTTMAHEIGHFIDHYLGDKNKKQYQSDDYTSLPGKIAKLFRQNMISSQNSVYLNRTTECFARAFEQYFCIKNNIEITGNYFCAKDHFVELISPLIDELLIEISKKPNDSEQEVRTAS